MSQASIKLKATIDSSTSTVSVHVTPACIKGNRVLTTDDWTRVNAMTDWTGQFVSQIAVMTTGDKTGDWYASQIADAFRDHLQGAEAPVNSLQIEPSDVSVSIA